MPMDLGLDVVPDIFDGRPIVDYIGRNEAEFLQRMFVVFSPTQYGRDPEGRFNGRGLCEVLTFALLQKLRQKFDGEGYHFGELSFSRSLGPGLPAFSHAMAYAAAGPLDAEKMFHHELPPDMLLIDPSAAQFDPMLIGKIAVAPRPAGDYLFGQSRPPRIWVSDGPNMSALNLRLYQLGVDNRFREALADLQMM